MSITTYGVPEGQRQSLEHGFQSIVSTLFPEAELRTAK